MSAGRAAGRAATPPRPDGVREIEEIAVGGDVPLHVHPEWAEAFPWLVQGTTGRGDEPSFDLGLFGDGAVGEALHRWRRLRDATGMPTAVHSRQVHGTELLEHSAAVPGLVVTEGFDGHLTGHSGVLLTVSVADCVPISIVDPGRRRVALLHGGWRGTAAGILGLGLERLRGDPAGLRVHLGPAICGRCYEVGPEVHEALGLDVPAHRTPVDVRSVQAHQAVAAGVPPDQVTTSSHCTRCGTGFFSHRGGDPGRQMGVLGIRS